MTIELTLALVSAALLTTISLVVLRPAADALNLVDHPDSGRKQHKGKVPLTGGIALLVSLGVVFAFAEMATPWVRNVDAFWPLVLMCLFALVTLHAIDDIIELKPITRFGVDALLAFFLAYYGYVKLITLGDLFGQGEVQLGRYAVPMTIFCFIAASNAFNMTDGIDSLCTGLGIVSFSTIVILIIIHDSASSPLIPPLLIVIAALIPMYAANLGAFGARGRAFLGDSGARLIGFMAAMALVISALHGVIRPVTAYFPIAVPVCDCLVLMGWRMFQRRSPLSADRLHLHHLLLDTGLSAAATRRIILAMAVGFSICGIVFEMTNTATWLISAFVVISFWCFIGLRIWLSARVRRRAAAVASAPPA